MQTVWTSLDPNGPLWHWAFPTWTRQAWALRSVQSGRKTFGSELLHVATLLQELTSLPQAVQTLRAFHIYPCGLLHGLCHGFLKIFILVEATQTRSPWEPMGAHESPWEPIIKNHYYVSESLMWSLGPRQRSSKILNLKVTHFDLILVLALWLWNETMARNHCSRS